MNEDRHAYTIALLHVSLSTILFLSWHTGDGLYAKTDIVNSKWYNRILGEYQRPCLTHELDIIGCFLDLDLERRYQETRPINGVSFRIRHTRCICYSLASQRLRLRPHERVW
jgi:hypothetical protein